MFNMLSNFGGKKKDIWKHFAIKEIISLISMEISYVDKNMNMKKIKMCKGKNIQSTIQNQTKVPVCPFF